MNEPGPERPPASLPTGARLGHYRIEGRLGAGGMGEVFAARDEKLGREVAIKVLHSGIADHPEHRARFEREAKLVAALNHPHVVTLHAVEEADGRLFLVMERVHGRSLAQRIPPAGFAIGELLALAIPLADAVGAAHALGITHRDLKPDNVMIGDDGRLRVLDFGIARLSPVDDGNPAAAGAVTETAEGMVIGTVAYMSPEQAQGRRVDTRSDVFSLGVVLFEMATGRRPFQGDSAITLAAAILKDHPPPVSALAPSLPRGIDRIVRRCLQKDPARRYQSALDLRNDLEELRDEPAPSADRPASGAWSRRALALALLPAVVLAATLALVLARARSEAPRAPELRGPALSRVKQLTSDEGAELSPALSPDGTTFVYASRVSGNWDIYRQRVGGENPMNLSADAKGDDYTPALSPDGEQIAFASDRGGGGLFVMGATGESVRRLTTFGVHPSWSPDASAVAFSTMYVSDPTMLNGQSVLYVASLAGGEPRKLVSDAQQPAWSPHGQRIAFWRVHKGGVRDLFTIAAGGGEPRQLTDDPALDWSPVWSPDGRWLYFSSDRGGNLNLWRLPIDEASGSARGPAEAVTNGAGTPLHSLAFSRDGRRAVLVAGGPRSFVERVGFDAAHERVSSPPERIVVGDMPSVHGELYAYRSTLGGQEDLAVVRADGTGRRRLTNDRHRDRLPSWAPDGSEIFFKSDRGGQYDVWAIRPDGSGLRQITEFGDDPPNSMVASPDGRLLAVAMMSGVTWLGDPRRPVGAQTPRRVPPPPGLRFGAWAWSADGKLLAGDLATDDGLPAGVATLDLAAGTFHRIPLRGVGAVCPGDCRRMVYVGEGALRLLDVATGRDHVLLADPSEEIGNLQLTPDLRWIYYQRTSLEGNVWMATFE